MYIPLNCLPLSEIKDLPQIRLGIQGYGGTGKTWSALTFPNPIVLNLDRGLGAHVGRADVVEIPFYKQEFCKTILPSFKPSDLKDIILSWLYKEGMKFSPEQTLIVDSNTSIQNAYHAWFNANRMNFLTSDGKVDGFAEYKLKKQYYGELVELLKALPCHVVFICHEVEATIGKLSGKLRPLLTGQFADELVPHFTDFFRQQATDKPKDFNAIEVERLKDWNMDRKQFQDMCAKYPRNTIYYWQTEGDNNFDGKCSSLVEFPRFLPANFESFIQYRRKPKIQTV